MLSEDEISRAFLLGLNTPVAELRRKIAAQNWLIGALPAGSDLVPAAIHQLERLWIAMKAAEGLAADTGERDFGTEIHDHHHETDQPNGWERGYHAN